MKRTVGLKLSVIALLATIISLVCYITDAPCLSYLELKTQDLRMLHRDCTPASSHIVIVAVDEKSLDMEGRWPWPRSKLGTLVTKLSDAGARVIGFDMFFPEPEAPNTDTAFADAVRQSKARIVFGYHFHFSKDDVEHVGESEAHSRASRIAHSAYPCIKSASTAIETPFVSEAIMPEANIPELSSPSTAIGFVNISRDNDGVCRSIPGVIRFQERFYPALSLEIARRYLSCHTKLVMASDGVRYIQLGSIRIPTDDRGDVMVGQSDMAFKTVSATDVLADRVPANIFCGNIVMVGATAAGLHDSIVTPKRLAVPGVTIHASLVDGILKGDFIIRPSWRIGATPVCILVLGLLLGLILAWTKPWMGVLAFVLLISGYTCVCSSVFTRDGILLDLVYPVAAWFFVYASVITARILLVERTMAHAESSLPKRQ